jgi:phospholipid/cholesterol/gamma-HCH transport system substrate-binding protein
MNAVGKDTNRLSADFTRVAGDLRNLSASLDRTAKEAEALLKENREPISDFTASGLYDFTLLMAELRGLVTNLSRVTTKLERDPGDFLFGGTRQGVDVQ